MNENNLESFVADLEKYINVLIEYKNSKTARKSKVRNTLLIDRIPEKNFSRVVSQKDIPNKEYT